MMKRRVFLVGMVTGLIAAGAGGLLLKTADKHVTSDEPRILLSISYEKPDGPSNRNANFEGLDDPWSELSVSDGLVRLASRCAVIAYVLDEGPFGTHSNSIAQLHLVLNSLPAESFECLVEAVNPPFVTMSKGEEDCTPRDPNMVYDMALTDFQETQSLSMEDII